MKPNEFACTSILSACADAGLFLVRKQVHAYVRRIEEDLVSWNAVLSEYMNAGRINEAKLFFDEMPEKNPLAWTDGHIYKIKSGDDHYARLIDMLSRAERLPEAKEIIQNMPYKPGASIWEALLSGCRTLRNVDLGVEAAEILFELTPQHDGTYLLLANTLAAAG
ncbi:hypothetical protein T459_12667 [Capsicum annuum]|uniref:Pentatricopeptide repeat-containing protein n=1 Tax=Capsicum annuum TaxID=4072 RepID=A0A2G2ZQK3_CAPAN|nr:hypothetical protein T459_12667 [Capsicum annuum]